MSYFLLEFAETTKGDAIEPSMVEYDRELNLTVLKGTKTPALQASSLATETQTKISNEASDSDRDARHNLTELMSTSTQTRKLQEPSDSDKDLRQLTSLMSTSTQTYVKQEASDSDKDSYHLGSL